MGHLTAAPTSPVPASPPKWISVACNGRTLGRRRQHKDRGQGLSEGPEVVWGKLLRLESLLWLSWLESKMLHSVRVAATLEPVKCTSPPVPTRVESLGLDR